MTRLAAALLAVLVLSPSAAWAGEPIELEAPADQTIIRAEQALVTIELAPGQAWVTELQTEVDGVVVDSVPLSGWPGDAIIELGPGLHKVSVVGVDRRDGETIRSPSVRVVVLPESKAPPEHRRWTDTIMVIAFVLALAGGVALSRRGRRR